MADEAKLRLVISDILNGADLKTITAKKVRQQAEEKLKLDLTDRKKEFDQLVMETLEEKQDKSEVEEESEEEEKPKKKAPSAKRRAAKASDSDDDDDEYKPESKSKKSKKAADSDSDDDWKSKSKPKAKSGGGAKGAKKGGGTGYTKTCKLSPELANVMGVDNMARHEVVKQMWKIIKEKNLYDPKNKQFAICNEDLLPVFGVKRFRTFGMMKYLKNHFTD